MTKISTITSELEQLQANLINRVEDSIKLYKLEREDVVNALGLSGYVFAEPPSPSDRRPMPQIIFIQQMDSFLRILDIVRSHK